MINSDILDYFDEQPENPKENIIIGIDLGTSNSCCSYWDADHYVMIPDENNNILFPSIITFDKNDKIYSCNEAKKYILNDNYFYETKRLIGRNYSDEFIQQEKDYLTYDIFSDETDKIYISKTINDKLYKITPEEVSSYVLSSIKHSAEIFLKQEIKDCVITVPAYFNEAQKQATRNAALIAGLNCIMIICEPVASAFAYGIIHKNNYKILVYDFGGGTLDVSLLNIKDNVFEVVETSGNMHIGGLDFDKIIYNYCISIFKRNNKKFNINKLSIDKQKELLSKAEIAKKELSDKLNTIIKIDNFYDNNKLLINLSRSKFEELSNKLLLMSMSPINKIFENKTLNKNDIDEIILVGGMTRMPIIQENIKNYFDKQPNTSMNPDYIVAIGAGIQGYLLSHPEAELSQSIILLNTTALSIGVEVENEFMDILIPRSTIIPFECKKIYTNQTEDDSIKIKLFEGERQLTKDNYLIGEFSIEVEKKPPGQHKISVCVSIDLNNMIKLTATNLANNESKELIINVKDKQLSKEEINEIIENANKYKKQDKLNKKIKKNYNTLLNLINIIDKNKNKITELHLEFDINIIDVIKKTIDTYTLKELKECIELIKPIATIIITEDTNLKLDFSGNINNTLTSINGNMIEKQNNSTSIYQDDNISCEKEIIDDVNIIKENNEELIDKIHELEDLCSIIIEYLDNIEDDKLENDSEDKLQQSLSDLYDYINNILLYIHISTNLTIEYLQKIINDVENKYNDFITLYNTINNITDYDELVILCKSLNNILNMENSNNILVNELKEIINNVLNKQNNYSSEEINNLMERIQKISEEIVGINN